MIIVDNSDGADVQRDLNLPDLIVDWASTIYTPSKSMVKTTGEINCKIKMVRRLENNSNSGCGYNE